MEGIRDDYDEEIIRIMFESAEGMTDVTDIEHRLVQALIKQEATLERLEAQYAEQVKEEDLLRAEVREGQMRLEQLDEEYLRARSTREQSTALYTMFLGEVQDTSRRLANAQTQLSIRQKKLAELLQVNPNQLAAELQQRLTIKDDVKKTIHRTKGNLTKIKDFKINQMSFKKVLSELESEVSQIKGLTFELSTVNKENQELDAKMKDYAAVLNTKQEELSAINIKLAESERQKLELTARCDKAVAEQTSRQNEVKAKKSELENKIIQLNQMERLVEWEQKQAQEEQAKYADMCAELQRLREKKLASADEKAALHAQIADLKLNIADLQNTVDRYQEESEHMKEEYLKSQKDNLINEEMGQKFSLELVTKKTSLAEKEKMQNTLLLDVEKLQIEQETLKVKLEAVKDKELEAALNGMKKKNCYDAAATGVTILERTTQELQKDCAKIKVEIAEIVSESVNIRTRLEESGMPASLKTRLEDPTNASLVRQAMLQELQAQRTHRENILHEKIKELEQLLENDKLEEETRENERACLIQNHEQLVLNNDKLFDENASLKTTYDKNVRDGQKLIKDNMELKKKEAEIEIEIEHLKAQLSGIKQDCSEEDSPWLSDDPVETSTPLQHQTKAQTATSTLDQQSKPSKGRKRRGSDSATASHQSSQLTKLPAGTEKRNKAPKKQLYKPPDVASLLDNSDDISFQ